MITRFVGHDGDTYTFPTSPGDQDFHTNFGEVVGRVSRLPGASGGVDEWGQGRAPNAIGNIQFSFYFVTDTASDMQPLRDELKTIIEWGRGKLYDELPDGSERWVNCRVNNITISEERHKHTAYHQKVQISFQAADPFWYTEGTTFIWGGGETWGGGATWGGGGSLTTFSSVGTMTVTNNGSAYTIPEIRFQNDSGVSVTSVLIERMIGGTVRDSLTCEQDIPAGGYVLLLPSSHTIQSSLGDLGADVITFSHPDWFRLSPGSNTIRVTPAGSTVKVGFNFYERYT